MVLPLAAKIIIPVGIGLAGLLGFVATAKAGPVEGEISEAIRNKIQAAIATGDPTTIRRVADEIERAGLTAQAKSMRDAANAIERAIDDVRPTPVTPGGGGGILGPVTPPSPSEARVVRVKAGEGPFQVTQRAGINTKLFKQLRDRNIPFDADGVRRKSDGQSGFAPGLDEGDRLFVPETWPDSPAFTVETVTPPAANVAGDDDGDPREKFQRLAGRVALNVQSSKKGREDRNLIHTLQSIARRRGQRQQAPNGLYDAETICQLARQHAIVPPARFGDDKGPYWPTNAAPAQRTVRECLLEMADRDPVRCEEWKQAAACF